MRYCFAVLLALFLFSSLPAQPPDVPNIDSLTTAEDFKYYEDKILLCIEWLRSTPLNEFPQLRIRIGEFVRYWTEETPTLTLVRKGKIAYPILVETKYRYTPDIYMAYYTGMLEHLILYPEDDDQYNIQASGVENVLYLYYYNKELLKDSEAIKLFLKLSEEGKLEKWIRRRI